MADKLNERSKTFIIDVFCGYTVAVVTSNDIHESAAKRGIVHTDGWEAMHCGASSALYSLIFLPTNAKADVIAHEAFHCVWHIMKMIGADHENEVMAYTLSYVIGEITAFMNKEKRQRRKHTPKRGAVSKSSLCHSDTMLI